MKLSFSILNCEKCKFKSLHIALCNESTFNQPNFLKRKLKKKVEVSALNPLWGGKTVLGKQKKINCWRRTIVTYYTPHVSAWQPWRIWWWWWWSCWWSCWWSASCHVIISTSWAGWEKGSQGGSEGGLLIQYYHSANFDHKKNTSTTFKGTSIKKTLW